MAEDKKQKCPQSLKVVTWPHVVAVVASLATILALFGAAPASTDRVKALEENVSRTREEVKAEIVEIRQHQTTLETHAQERHKELMGELRRIQADRRRNE